MIRDIDYKRKDQRIFHIDEHFVQLFEMVYPVGTKDFFDIKVFPANTVLC